LNKQNTRFPACRQAGSLAEARFGMTIPVFRDTLKKVKDVARKLQAMLSMKKAHGT